MRADVTRADAAGTWTALTDPSTVARWFADVGKPGPVGAPYRIDFGDGSVVAGTVHALEPGRRLAYTWAWEGQEPRQETLVSWTIEPDPGGGTRVTLVHSGWAEAGADEATRDDHTGYWEMYLDDLVRLLDGGAASGPATGGEEGPRGIG